MYTSWTLFWEIFSDTTLLLLETPQPRGTLEHSGMDVLSLHPLHVLPHDLYGVARDVIFKSF